MNGLEHPFTVFFVAIFSLLGQGVRGQTAKREKICVVYCAGILVLFSPCLQQGSIAQDYIAADADAFIKRVDADVNFGLGDNLEIKNAASFPFDQDFDRKVYIRFQTAGLPKNLLDCRLQLEVIEGDGNTENLTRDQCFTVYGLNDGVEGGDWNESLITWNNAPQNVIDSATEMGEEATVLGSFEIDGTGIGTSIQFCSLSLKEFIESDRNELITIVIVREFFDPCPEGYHQTFASRENLEFHGPRLVVLEYLLGDVNQDGAVDLLDVSPFIDLLAAGGFQNEADINQDRSIDLLDVQPFIDLLAG